MRISQLFASLFALGLSSAAALSFLLADPEPASALVRRLLLERRYDDAVQRAEGALAGAAVEPAEAEELRFFLAHARLLKGDLAGARSAFQVLIERHGTGRFASKGRFQLADLERAEGRHAEATAGWSERARFLVSPERKREIAAIYLRFAEVEEKAEPPRWDLARGFYDLALELGLPREEAARYGLAAARAADKIPDPADAARRYLALLATHGDGSDGEHLFGAAEALRASGDPRSARTRYEELLRRHARGAFASRAWLGVAATHGFPAPGGDLALERGAEALRTVLREFADSKEAAVAALELARALLHRGRVDEGVEAAESFLARYAESDEERAAEARILIGEARAGQQRYPAAVAAWKVFLGAHPFHGRWAEVQTKVVDAELAEARFRFREERFDEARAAYEEFLARYPLDARAAQIHFELGALEAQRKQWTAAIERWERVAAKYPQSDPSSQALFEIGRVQDKELDQAERARETWKRCTFGSFAGAAAEALQVLEKPFLKLLSPRVFANAETIALELATRNIEKLRVRVYPIDLATYFAAEQSTDGVEDLDLEVIEAARTFEWKPAAYRALREIESKLEIPADGPGCWVVKVDDERLEATCVALRSDLRILVRSTRGDLVVYAENARTGAAAANVPLEITDGAKPLFDGATDARGLYYRRAKELQSASRVVVFALSGDGTAASGIDLSALSAVQSLEARTHLATERAAYEPGETVHWRAIVRDVKDGRYAFAAGAKYAAEWLDPGGRLVHREELSLSAFGTLAGELALDPNAPFGAWSVRVVRADIEGAAATSASFDVAPLERAPLELALEIEQPVLRLGEKLTGAAIAKHFHGAPAAGRAIRVVAWNGTRELRGTTDAGGRFAFSFDTEDAGEGDAVFPLYAVLEEERLTAVELVAVRMQTKQLRLTTLRDVYVAGESFDLKVELRDLLGEKIGGKLELDVLRLVEERGRIVERKEQGHALEIPAESGDARQVLALAHGGRWRIRARVEDRPGSYVSAELELFVSGEEDEQKLRILHAGEELSGSGEAEIRVLSRLQPARALVTWTGDGILRYDVRALPRGESMLRFEIGADLAPGFALDLCAAEGDALHAVGKAFRVPRALRVEIVPEKKTALPGERVKADLRAFDAAGKPAAAELALAVVDQAFLAVHPDRAPALEGFFGGERNQASRIGSSVLFRSEGRTKAVVEELVEEVARRGEIEERAKRWKTLAYGYDEQVEGQSGEIGEDKFRLVDPIYLKNDPAATSTPRHAFEVVPANPELLGDAWRGQFQRLEELSVEGRRQLSARFALGFDVEAAQTAGSSIAGYLAASGGPGAGAAALLASGPRVDFRATALFAPRVTTDAEGRATIDLTWPDTTTGWQWTARGVTRDTLVGSATLRTATRLELEAKLDLPPSLVAGDEISLDARALNLNAGSNERSVAITASGSGAVEGRAERAAEPLASGAEARVEVSLRATRAGDARVRAEARSGDVADTVERTLRVEADVAEVSAVESGVARDGRHLVLELPAVEGLELQGFELEIGAVDLEDLAELALGGGGAVFRKVACPPVDLLSGALARGLGALHVLQAAEARASLRPETTRRLRAAIEQALARVAGAQRADGGFDWIGSPRGGASEMRLSARAHAFLARSAKAGFAVARGALPASRAYLVKALAGTPSAVEQACAVAAFAVEGEAEFARLNRLLREQGTLPSLALAALAEACFEQGRPELAREALAAAAKRVQRDRRGAFLPADALPAALRAAQADTIEATARLLAVVAALDGGSALAFELAAFLEGERGASGFGGDAASEAALLALARVRAASAERADVRVVAKIGAREILSTGDRLGAPGVRVFVPAAELGGLKVELDLEASGSGEYRFAAVLRGVVPGAAADLASPALPPAQLERAFLAAPLRVDGKAIPIGFDTVQKIAAPWRHEIARLSRGESASTETRFEAPEGCTHLVLEEPLPAGVAFVPGSARGPFVHHEVRNGRLLFFFAPELREATVRYEVQAVFAGQFAARGARLWSYVAPERRWTRATQRFLVAPRGSEPAPRRLTPDELYHLGKAAFDSGRLENALAHLEPFLAGFAPREAEGKEASRMVFFGALKLGQHAKVVQVFEVLKDRYADLVIGFEDMLLVADAYKALGEHERGTDVLRGVTEASFLREVGVAGALEERGRFLEAVRFLARLCDEYPDSDVVISTAARLPQMVASRAGAAIEGEDGKRLTRRELLGRAALLAEENLARWPEGSLADEVAFGLVGSRLEREEYARAVELCALFEMHYPRSKWRDDFLYARGFAHFALGQFDTALAELERVERERFPDGKGGEAEASQRDPAIWMVAQIHQARGRLAEALASYRRVEERFSDATLAIQQLERQELAMPEVTQVAPGEPAVVKLESRNLSALSVRVYKVDLVRLYLLEKSLDAMTKVRLSGVTPAFVRELALEGDTAYAPRTTPLELPIRDPGAYLVVATAEAEQAAGMLVVSDLAMDVWTDARAGLVRVALSDKQGGPLARADVKAVGSEDGKVQSAETDLRGIAALSGVVGRPTLVARAGERVAFYRGEVAIGARKPQRQLDEDRSLDRFEKRATEELYKSNTELNDRGGKELESLLKQRTKGVQVQQTRGKS